MRWTGRDCQCGHPIVKDAGTLRCSVCGQRYGSDMRPEAPYSSLVWALDAAIHGETT